MTPGVEVHPEAVAELRAARLWYQSHDHRVAQAFTLEYKRAVARVADHPERWSLYLHGTRRHRFRGFPYFLIYLVRSGSVLVLAVAHERRLPGYWRGRY